MFRTEGVLLVLLRGRGLGLVGLFDCGSTGTEL